MKTILSTIFFASIFSFAAAQNSATINMGDFTGIRSANNVDIEITQGSACSVTFFGDQKCLGDLKTAVKNGVLVIDPNDICVDKIQVTVAHLNMVQADGVTSVKGTNTLTTDSLTVYGSGSSDIKLDVKASKVNATLSGASSLKITGTTTDLTGMISGVSDLKAYDLQAQNANVSTSGSSAAHVSVSNSIIALASGASDIHYKGDPATKQVTASGSASIGASDGGTTTDANDTTSFVLGGHKLRIIDEGKVDDDDRSKREKKATDKDFQFWRGLDIGVTGYLTSDNMIALPKGFENLELNYGKSYLFAWNFWQKNIHIYQNKLNLCTGLGLSWYHYNFRYSYSLVPDAPFQNSMMDSLNYRKNRLNVCYINVPLYLEFNSNKDDARKSFHIGGGMEFGYNVFHNKLKQKYDLDGHTYKRVVKNDFNINPFRFDAVARIGYGNFTLFGMYSLTTLFELGKGPVVYPFTAGINLNF